MHNRLISFLSRNTTLTEAQHGFRKKRSTETAIHTFLQSIQESVEKKEIQTGIFCDLTKAYDAINLDILLSKLNSYGVRGVANSLFESYLARRQQVVEINYNGNKGTIQGKHVSAPTEIKHRVPQGSILGPILFLLYINFLEATNIPIPLISESHLQPSAEFKRPNYTTCPPDRLNQQGGRTAILIRQDFKHSEIHLPLLQHMEATAIQLNINKESTILISVYNPPQVKLQNEI
jgi:hypothetical protein